jgi:hypothetical protein
MYENEKIKVNKSIEYLKNISIQEPTQIQLEEIVNNSVVLSYVYKGEYLWNQREYKRFTFDEADNIISMININKE